MRASFLKPPIKKKPDGVPMEIGDCPACLGAGITYELWEEVPSGPFTSIVSGYHVRNCKKCLGTGRARRDS